LTLARTSELCGGGEEHTTHEPSEEVLAQLEQQFPTLPPDVVKSVWKEKLGDEAAVMEALSGLCAVRGEGELDMKIWRKCPPSPAALHHSHWGKHGGCGDEAFVPGGGGGGGGGAARDLGEEEEEAAQAVLTAVFLTPESVERLAEKIPFARETSDLQLRLVVNAEPNNIESFLCPFGDVVYIQVSAWGERNGSSFAHVTCSAQILTSALHVTLYSKYAIAMTFKNFSPGTQHAHLAHPAGLAGRGQGARQTSGAGAVDSNAILLDQRQGWGATLDFGDRL
jgi:hypothetical protein